MLGVSEVAVDPLVGKSNNLEKYEKPYHLNGTPNVNLASLGIMMSKQAKRAHFTKYIIHCLCLKTNNRFQHCSRPSLGPGPLLSTQQGEGKKKKKRKERERGPDHETLHSMLQSDWPG